MNLGSTGDFDVHTFGQRIDNSTANTVQTTDRSIGTAAELTAGVQLRHDQFYTAQTCLRFDVNGNAARTVVHRDRAVRIESHSDLFSVAGQGFIDGIVDDLPQAVHETARISGADVHTGPFANRVEPFQYLELLCAVLCFGRHFHVLSL